MNYKAFLTLGERRRGNVPRLLFPVNPPDFPLPAHFAALLEASVSGN
jgi:hypothetical protein